MKWKKRLYKPTGPDGKGWGDFRSLNENDLQVLAEFQKQEEKDAKRRLKLETLKELQQPTAQQAIVVDEDKRWEIMFR